MDRHLTTDELHRELDDRDLPTINRWRAQKGLRYLYLEELAERWSAPDYAEAMRELRGRP